MRQQASFGMGYGAGTKIPTRRADNGLSVNSTMKLPTIAESKVAISVWCIATIVSLQLCECSSSFSDCGIVASRSYTQQPATASSSSALVSPIATVSTRSDIECATACAARVECRTFRFSPRDSSCAVYAAAAASAGGDVAGAAVKFEAIDTACPYKAKLGARQFCVFQHRSSASVDFARTWVEYESGFGDGANLWIGLQRINQLTSPQTRVLRVRMLQFDGTEFYSEFAGFTVGNASVKYTMNYTEYLYNQSNVATDCLAIKHNGMMFSTKDRDNDIAPGFCSPAYGNSGFWFGYCLSCNPNGVYPVEFIANNTAASYVHWKCLHNDYTVLQSISMMVEV